VLGPIRLWLSTIRPQLRYKAHSHSAGIRPSTTPTGRLRLKPAEPPLSAALFSKSPFLWPALKASQLLLARSSPFPSTLIFTPMVDSADEPPLSSHQHSWAKNKTPSSWNPLRTAHEDPGSTKPSSSTHIGTETVPHHVSDHPSTSAAGPAPLPDHHVLGQDNGPQNSSVVDKEGDGAESSPIGTTEPKASLVTRFARDAKRIIFASWINWLLVFVPVGIILGVLVDWVHIEAVSPSVVFAINAVAIIPLASLLAFATESVATKLGDTIGALLNVTFGNAVELIIFIIALVAKEVRVVQAAALGSILSNLLLILGMCFVAGGLRFREQLYNSAASQTSACLLCLSVISLVLPVSLNFVSIFFPNLYFF